MKKIEVTDEIFFRTAEKFVEIFHEAVGARDRMVVALAGGSTPQTVYQLLAGKNFRSEIDWSRCFFFFGDERNVSPMDKESNFRLADEYLFKPLAISENQIFRWPVELEKPENIAENYRETIENFFNLKKNEFPRFDLVLLGIGDDGHTASLFPGTRAVSEKEKTAVENWVEKLPAWRFTLTFPTINNAANVIFLVTGKKKAKTMKEILEGDFQPSKFPAQQVEPCGELLFLIDPEASELLKNFNISGKHLLHIR